MSVCSSIKVTHDPGGTPVVLLDYGDTTSDWLRIDGRRVVDAVDRLRAAGRRHRGRGNEAHSIEFEVEEDVTTGSAAAAAVLDHAAGIGVPEGAARLRIEVEGQSRYYEFESAIVESWPAGHDQAHTRRAYKILTGAAGHIDPS